MADINIEKKSNKKPVWPWILGVLLLLALVWGIAELSENTFEGEEVAATEEEYRDEPIATDPQNNPQEENPYAGNFINYVNENIRKGRMGEDPQVIGEAFIKLSAVMEAFSEQEGVYTQQIEEVRRAGQQIQSDSPSQQKAEILKNASSTAALVLKEIQQKQFPDAAAEATDLQEKARAIEADVQLSEQKGQVEAFFERATDVVVDMRDIEASKM